MFFAAIFMLGALGTEDLKQSIQELEQLAPDSQVYLKLARSYLRDQEQEKAFKTFLKALEGVDEKPVPMSEEEKLIYNEALKSYLNHRPEETDKVSYQILQKYGPILEKHPEYKRLGYIVASAYANMKLYEPFFVIFYNSYGTDPDHFLASKAIACLHIKLLERAKTEGERESERVKVIDWLAKAEKANPLDFSLYRIQVLFSHVKDRKERIKGILNKIVDLPMIPSRSDALFFTELAYETQETAFADKFLNKALESFPGSRVLSQVKERHGK